MKTAAESVVRAIAKVMAEARAGNIEAVAIIYATPEGKPEVSFAGETELVCQINTGADMLKHFVLGKIIIGQMRQTSGLVVPAEPLQS